MPHEFAKALQWSRFHFVVGDFASFVFKGFDAVVEVGIGQWQAQFAALRAIETYRRDCIAAHHITAADAGYQFGVGIDYVRFGP